MSSKKIILIVLVVVFVVASFYLVYAAGRKSWPFRTKYQVVVLETGEVYFGKLSLFPSPKMIDAWMPQQSQDEQNPGLQLIPLSSMYFAPEGNINLERSRISWWANLQDESDVVKIMTGKVQSTGSETQTTTETPAPAVSPTQ